MPDQTQDDIQGKDWTARAIEIAQAIDALRIAPRVLMVFYGGFLAFTGWWYMFISARSTQDAVVLSTIAAAFAKLCDYYFRGGRNNS